MKKILLKKKLLLIIAFLVVSSSAIAYVFIKGDSSTSDGTSGPKITQVETLFGYIGAESDYSKFNSLIGMFDSSKYMVENEAGLEPSLVVFAPNNDAFNQEELKPFDAMTLSAKDQVKLYHIATIYPDSPEASVNLELSDDRVIKTLSGRELTVTKKNNNVVLIDGKGRESTVSKDYAVSPKGDRIYFIDKVLLFQ